MKIDWEHAQIRPKKKQKIEGKYLLNLRTKMVDLEQELAQKNREIDQAREKLTITEQSFNQLTEKFISSETNLNHVITDLKRKLRIAESRVTEKDVKGDGSLEKIKELEQKISNKDNELMRVKFNLEKANKEIESIKARLNQNSIGKGGEIGELSSALEKTNRELEVVKRELAQALSIKNLDFSSYENEIEQKTKQIEINKQDLDHTILTKDSIIAKLEDDLEKKLNQIDELNNTINDLYDQISNNKDHKTIITNESEVMRKIKELLNLKGFITDKELEQML